MKKKLFIVFILIAFAETLCSQPVNPVLLKKTWAARWIEVPGSDPQGYGIYYFRKKISLEDKPGSFVIHVSADNRYKLFVNGKLVSLGPARGDAYYWNFETLDIAADLVPGDNTIGAIVWNEGALRPEGQISNRTAFLVQGDTEKENILNTGNTWKCYHDRGYAPIRGIGYNAYYVAGPGEKVDMQQQPEGWMRNDFTDADWKAAAAIGWRGASPKGIGDISGWMLVPSPLPQMELRPQRFGAVRRAENLSLPAAFPAQRTTIHIPANTHASFLLDQSFLTNAYPVIRFSKGKDAVIGLIFAESLFSEIPNGPGKSFHKGNRNEVEGKFIAGRKDSILSNGKEGQEFETLDWRTFRYVQVSIDTKEEGLDIDDMYSVFTGYPFQLKAGFDAKDDTLQRIFETGWRTARSCAVETYMDCPYYEQLQYIGDTRIQALVSLYNSGDDRLVRNAINQMDHSRIAEGITLSRHPSFSPQQIPTFSLWYIGMLYDYWMYRGDSAFIQNKLQGMRDVLWFFANHQQADGSLRDVPYWLFTDWVENKPGWGGGVAPIGADGCSSVLDLQLLWALQLASKLETQLGIPAMAARYREKAELLKQTIQKKYWDASRKLYADTDEKDKFSQHANTLAILTGMVKGDDAHRLAVQLLKTSSLAPASIYFKYYLHQALVKAGMGNDYLEWLGKWKENLQMGLTTWAEISEIDQARSDCHAWGSSPNIEFFRTVMGIDTDAPGFKKVRITPHLDKLEAISGTMPHPDGMISVNYRLVRHKWTMEIGLPGTVSGTFVWKEKTYPLKGGKNKLEIDN